MIHPVVPKYNKFEYSIWLGSQSSSITLIPTARIGAVDLVAVFLHISLVTNDLSVSENFSLRRLDCNNLQLFVHLFWCSHVNRTVARLFLKPFESDFVSVRFKGYHDTETCLFGLQSIIPAQVTNILYSVLFNDIVPVAWVT